jgi:hypothetical protein
VGDAPHPSPHRPRVPAVYARLADYEVRDDGRPIGRIKEECEPVPGRAWSWWLHITNAHEAGFATSGYAASPGDAKAAFRVSLERYREWAALQGAASK